MSQGSPAHQGGPLGSDPGDVFSSRSFLVTKHSWKGKYKRVFSITPRGVTTLNPTTMEATNHWTYQDVVSVIPSAQSNPGVLEYQIVFRKGRKTDSMRFSSEHRAQIVTDALKHHERFAEKLLPAAITSDGYKYHWSEQRLRVCLQIAPHGLHQIDPNSRKILATYFFKDIKQIYEVTDYPGGFVLQEKSFGRLHLFASENRGQIVQRIIDNSQSFIGICLEKPKPFKFNSFVPHKFGKFSDDLHLTTISDFIVYKQSHRHQDPVRRRLCLTETCLVERDPKTDQPVSLKPLSKISALIRHLENAQLFSIQYSSGDVRTYTSAERDSLLASFLDGVRGSGNRDVHVRMSWMELGKRFCPLECLTEEEVEASHLKFLMSPPPGWTFAECVSRFNANVSYSGLTHAVTQEYLFAQNKEKLIHAALTAILNRDILELDQMPVQELEQEFHALRRLVASKAGFSAFTHLPGFREKIGMKVARSLKLGHDGISHAAIDMICTLMEPMHENYDLKQEQLNKSSLLSSEKFLEGLLDMWTLHVTRGTGALIVAAMLDFLTFALCAPYSETTDGKQFDLLLEKVASRGRTLYKLFQQPSHTIVKGAGLLMKAIIEEGNEEIGQKMQLLALREGALPIHLKTALFTDTENNHQLLMNCQLSRHLVGLWTANNKDTEVLLKRVFPAGLLSYLNSSELTPLNEIDRLHIRDNLKMAMMDTESDQGNVILRAAGKGLKQGKQIASKTAEVVGEKTAKYTDEAWKLSEKYMEMAMQHWRQKMGGLEWENKNRNEGGDTSRADLSKNFITKPQERPIVLRKRRQKIVATRNWSLFYYMFSKDHAQPNLIWNLQTREELLKTLDGEIRSFIEDRELAGGSLISWNYAEFEVTYNSLSDEIKIGDYFLRLLLEEDQSNDNIESVIDNAGEFFNDLYHRFLLTPKTDMKCLCLQAMTIVYGRHYEDIGSFHDTKYIVAMLERTTDRVERDRLLLFLNKLILHRDNAHALTQESNGVRILVDLLPLAHLHTSRAVVSNLSTAIEVNPDSTKQTQEKEWYYGNVKERNGPISFAELCDLFEQKQVHAKTKVWAQGLESWRLLQQVAQLKWTLIAKGQAVLNETEMSSLILGMLIHISKIYPSKDEDGAIIRPLPRVKQALSDSSNLPHIVQLLLTFDPVLVEKVSTLLYLVLEDNSCLPTLYFSGFFFFVLMYTGSNVLPIGRFLSMSHGKQAFRSEEKDSSATVHSILGQMLPDAMVAYLTNHGPDKFAEIFLGNFDTPEAIWNNEMRQFMIQKIAYHLADFSPRLKSNVRAVYQYCPIPMISYPPLENELFCHIYYLRNLCDTVKFPKWPILKPLNLLKEVLSAWKVEVEKKPSSMTARHALDVLGLTNVTEPEEGKVRKAYYKMSQMYHPDKNPNGRDMFEKINAAYQFLFRSDKTSDQPNPDNIVLILRAQSILFERYSNTLHPYKYAGYPMLIKTIQMETADEKLFSKSAPLLAAASECAYYTVRCSALNAEELRRENGLEVLYQAFERCVSVLSQSSKANDVAVQVCSHIIRFYSVASLFEQCRDRMVEMPELVKNICRVFYYKQVPSLCIVGAECVTSLSVDPILQMHFLQSGALWHLLLFFFHYDFTLEESGVTADEETSEQAVANKLAKIAVTACSRMAGLMEFCPELKSPKNPVIEECLTAMLTPYIVSRMRENDVEEILKLLNSNSENPYLVWDNSTRAELTEVLETERVSSVRRGTCDPTFGANFKFSAHENELIVGGIFVRIFNQQPMFQLKEPKRFAVDLLDYLNGQAQYLFSLLSMTNDQRQVASEKLTLSEMALEALANVIKHNRGVEIQCIGHFKLLFCLLRLESYNKLQEMALHVLVNVTGSLECMDDIAASKVLAFLLQVVYSLPDQVALAMTVLYSLMGDTRLIKEGLANGVVVSLVYTFCCASEQKTREKAADVLSKMSSDKLMGPKARIALGRFLPDIFLDAVRKSPEAGVQMFESNHENPELIWNDKSRENLTLTVKSIAKKHYNHLKTSPDKLWTVEDFTIDHGTGSGELVVSGIYIRLFIANPGWVLRKPREFLTDLLEQVIQMMQKSQPDLQRLEAITTALLKLLSTQPNLAEIIPATGYLSRIFSIMGSLDSKVVKFALQIVTELSRSTVCVESMAACPNCIMSIKRALTLRNDLISISCDAMSRIFSGYHDPLVKQALDCKLVEDLLTYLGHPNTNYESRAFIVKALKSMQASLTYGEQISAILKTSSIWKQFEAQKHDLFIQNDTPMGAITQVNPGVAGYLTNTSNTAPMMPPPLEENLHNPVNNNPLL